MKSKEVYKRKINTKKLAPSNYLIICEGKQTEPNYFNGLKNKINKEYKDKIDVFIPNIDIKGMGRNTIDLVMYTERFVNLSNKLYKKVYIVLDKDDYDDNKFNKAIKECNYEVLWSNPNFELWLILHFITITTYISKNETLKKIKQLFEARNLGTYLKNDKNIFEKVSKNNGLIKAYNNAFKLNDDSKLPSLQNPMTKVYLIIDELKEYLIE